MGMSFWNWLGMLMLFFGIFLNELYLGINAWYEVNLGAIVAGVVYLVVAIALSVWPSASNQSA
ncbi:MAG: hypothetical protein OEV99_14520 [Nitrospira sp.]|nr:hypothetical protein [Nitrospira sp.]MDH4371036.1 hypothetical protein [Nitrospira sp.]MDH5346967.1 hypothetical protein [Nitrospira sp.]MDH5498381.1 hypothetical protein [Nitrospira sp.]MDH5724545.1 hypothetical protein [Nitrospira sp.]